MGFPFPFLIGFGIGMKHLAGQIRAFLGPMPAKILIITGESISLRYAEEIKNELSVQSCTAQVHFGTVDEVHTLEAAIRPCNYSHLLSVGGGRVGDFSKRLALLCNIRLIMVPTIIANDGLISPIAVLREGASSISIPGRMPDAVFIDLEALNEAPEHYLVAAACDLVSNLSATNDWARFAPADVRPNFLAYYFSQAAADGVIWSADWSVASDTFVERVILGQILSGISMALAGSSRPCSGAEHLICHAIDQLGLAPSALHGGVVASTTRFALALQGALDPQTRDFLGHFRVPISFPGCEDLSFQDIERLFSTARHVRPGRRTILDLFSDRELAMKYSRFCSDDAAISDDHGGSTIRKLRKELRDSGVDRRILVSSLGIQPQSAASLDKVP
jgi:glycerol-1-phosphate dehydrogenase [NAD(P)+]